MDQSRQRSVYLAKISEQAERYEEMVEHIRQVAVKAEELTVEERHILSVAYKNLITPLRNSWRTLSSLEHRTKSDNTKISLMGTFRQKLEGELSTICNDILGILETNIVPSATSAEARVFYHKMSGDYQRYRTEFLTGAPSESAASKSLESYTIAYTIATAELPTTHPGRLGLALNFAVFYYDTLKSPERGCHLAKHAFDEAVADLEKLTEENYKESTLVLQLLRDNLVLWTSEEVLADSIDGAVDSSEE